MKQSREQGASPFVRENPLANDRISCVKEGIVQEIGRLGILSEGDTEGNEKRILYKNLLVLLLQFEQWKKDCPDQQWRDFAWEKRSDRWGRYQKARETRSFSEHSCLEQFREMDSQLDILEGMLK